MANKIQIKRGLKASLPALDSGEFGLCTDSEEVFIGNNGKNIDITNKSQLAEKMMNTKGTLANPFTDIFLGAFAKTESGYTKLPNGMILQWGKTLGSHDVYYPIAFPNACIWATSIGIPDFTDTLTGPYVTKSAIWTWGKTALAITTYGYEKLSSFTATQAGYVSTLSCADFGGKSLWLALGY